MDLSNIMKLAGGANFLGNLAKNFDLDENSIQSLLSNGMPAIMGAMKDNAATKEGASALLGAIEQHKGDDLMGMFQNIASVDKNDGLKILGHVFGGNLNGVMGDIAGKTGIAENKVTDLLSNLAPMVMGALGQKQKSMNLDASQITNLLSGGADLFNSGNILDAAKGILDKNNDGNLVDDIGGMLGGMFGK